MLVAGAWQVDDGILKVRGLVIEDEQGKAFVFRCGCLIKDR